MNVLAGIVNFLNSNFVGRRLVVGIVNVLGSFVGDIASEKDLTGGKTPQQDTQAADEDLAQVQADW